VISVPCSAPGWYSWGGEEYRSHGWFAMRFLVSGLVFTSALTIALLLPSKAPLHAQSRDSGAPSSVTEINGKKLGDGFKELKDPAPGARHRAVRAIVLFDPDVASKEAGPALIDGLIDRDASLRVNIILALHTIGVHDRDVEKAVPALIKRLDDPQA